jgi:outer membrane lipoprotein-sorting protein
MKKIFLTITSILISMLVSAQATFKIPETEEELGQLVEQMMVSVRTVKTAKFRFVKNERYEGKIVKSEQLVKLNVNPKKVYMKLLKGPHSGTEVLFLVGKNDNKAVVSAGSMVPTISLSPFNSLVRDKQRHTLYELGFSYTADLIYDAYVKYKHKAKEYAKYEGLIDYDGHKCHKITLDNKEYKLYDYTVKEGEDIIKIARRLKLDEYSILEYNPSVKDYSQVHAGQVIKLPLTFCKSTTMYVDAKSLLPVYQKCSDEKGLVAEYEYHELQVNIPIAEEEFTEKYKEYGF